MAEFGWLSAGGALQAAKILSLVERLILHTNVRCREMTGWRGKADGRREDAGGEQLQETHFYSHERGDAEV